MLVPPPVPVTCEVGSSVAGLWRAGEGSWYPAQGVKLAAELANQIGRVFWVGRVDQGVITLVGSHGVVGWRKMRQRRGLFSQILSMASRQVCLPNPRQAGDLNIS